MAATPALYGKPAITLLDPDTAARDARYIAFVEVSEVPSADSPDHVLYSFPWLSSNLTVRSSGALATENDSDTRAAGWPSTGSGEVRNATVQVWRQTDDLLRYIDSVEHGRLPMPLAFALTEVFSNTTSDVDYGFPRASIEFKVQNKTGVPRCDVDGSGAPVASVSPGATACVSGGTPTAKSTGKDDQGASSTASPSSSSKHNAASGLTGASIYGLLAAAVAAGVFVM